MLLFQIVKKKEKKLTYKLRIYLTHINLIVSLQLPNRFRINTHTVIKKGSRFDF